MDSFVIATHYFAFGTSQAFRDYLLRKKKKLLYIEHNLFASAFSWFIGAIDTFYQVAKTNNKFDIYFGSNRLNTIVGILLKKLKIVGRVIYFSPDWVESRVKNNILNRIYNYLDYLCVKHADIVWNSSTIMKIDPMMQKRIDKGYPQEWVSKQIQLPDGCDQFPYKELQENNRYKLGFVGHLIEGTGVEMLIHAFKKVLSIVPNATLYIIGSGPEQNKLMDLSKDLPIYFNGYVGDINKVYEILADCALAVAPYKKDQKNISQFTDPGKVKIYISLSLPVVITDVPQIAHEIKEKKAGIMTKDNPDEFAGGIISLLQNAKLLSEYRQNAHVLSKKYSWDNNFDRALTFL